MPYRYAESDLAFQNYSSFPKRIIYPSNYLPHGSDEGQAIIENFVQSMQSTFGMERVVTNVTEEILGAGFNITAINFASSVLNSWVSRLCHSNHDPANLWRLNRTNGNWLENRSPRPTVQPTVADSRRSIQLVAQTGRTLEPIIVMLFTMHRFR